MDEKNNTGMEINNENKVQSGAPMVHNEDGSWSPAKQEPYYNMGWGWLMCFFGRHEWFVSKKYRGTLVCFRCGKRKTGQKHY